MEIEKIDINLIEGDKFQPRKNFENIGNLIANILKEGLLEPLKVRKEKDRYIIIDGERRLKALRKLYEKEPKIYNFVDCIILNPKDVFITQLSYDIHKNKLNPFEEAEAFKKLLSEGWTIEDLKMRLGISGYIITRRIKLLGLNEETKKLIIKGYIPQSVITEIDFQKFKDNEGAILKKIHQEKLVCRGENVLRTKIKRIIKEETEKDEAILNHFRTDLKNFGEVISSYDIKLDDIKLDDIKLDDYINEPIKEVKKIINDNLWKVEQLIGIKERLQKIKKQLDKLQLKYGQEFELRKEILK